MGALLGRVALAALCAVPILAQTTPAQSPSASTAQQPFRTTTVVVEVDAVVTDKGGKFVPGLTADDFEVLENGKPQTISRLYIVKDRTISAAGPAEPTGAPAAVSEPAPSPAETTRVFVLFFDQEHLETGAFKHLRDAALQFLANQFHEGDVGGVVLGSTLAGNRLTTDRGSLVAAVKNAQPTAEKTSRRFSMLEWPRLSGEAEAVRIALANDRDVIDQAVRRACQDDPTACKNVDVSPMVMEKARMVVGELRPAARRTVMALQALATGLAKLPGRKSIILMTEGFFVEESWADLRQIVGAAARSNVRIYSIDARGIDTHNSADLRLMSPMDVGGGMPLEAYNTMEDGPNGLAIDTGGYMIRGTNDFAGALAQVALDTSEYYVIGYTPANAATDGSFRTITVKVKRPGLKVRARRGYLAVPAVPPVRSAEAAPPAAQPSPEAPVPSPESAKSPEAEPTTPAAAPKETPATEPTAPTTPGTAAAPTPNASSAATPGTAARGTSGGIRLRPDSASRVDQLASKEGATTGTSAAARGWERYQRGDLEGAADLLGQAAREPNAPPWVHYALGYARVGLQHSDDAIREWETVRKNVPEFQPVYLDLADAYAHQENYSRALDVLREAQKRWPADVEVLNAIGTVQVRRGALDDAITTFKKATAAKPDDALAYFNLGRTYHLRYFKTRRYSQAEAKWFSNVADARNAIASYQEYLKLGGPYESEAREAIQNLEWAK